MTFYIRNILFICVLLINSQVLVAQLSVKELDRQIQHKTKGKLTTLKQGAKENLLVVYIFKPDNKIFSVMKREAFGSEKKRDSLQEYQFAYVNDTLLRIWFSRIAIKDRKNGVVTAYISKNKIVAIDTKGDIYLPDLKYLESKSAELLELARSLVLSKR